MKVAHLSSYYVVKSLSFHRAETALIGARRNRVYEVSYWIESGIALIKCFHESLWKGIIR